MAEVSHFTTSQSKKPLDLDWAKLLPTDDSVDDRPPEIVITPAEKSKGCGRDLQQPKMEEKDNVYQTKTDGELEGMIRSMKNTIKTTADKLPDNGEKCRATLRRCIAEVERRKRNRDTKGGTRCNETLQVSDDSDDGDQKSSASPDFAKLLSEMLDEDENRSRTVDAFQDEFSLFQGRNMKQNGKGFMQQVSSRSKPFRCPTTFMGDNKKQRITNAVKKVSHSATSSPCHFFKNMAASSPKAHVPHNQPPRKLRSKNVSGYCLVDEDPLEETIDFWSRAPYNPSPKKSKPRHAPTYQVDEEPEPPILEKLDEGMQDVIVYYPSRDDQDSVEVVYKDMACLAPQAYLSSTIMNFYIRYLQQMTSSETIIGNFHFFNTYFYNKLQKLSYREEDSFVKFRKWWKGVNIFKKSYILLPIHDKAHWSLGIICIPSEKNELGPIVLHLDSLGLHNSKSILDNITSFVKEEWKYLRNSQDSLNLPITDEIWKNLDHKIHDRIISVPQQRNEYDCGLFVLYYMERFIKEAPHRLKEEHLSMFGKKWFRPEEASGLRRRIHNLLVQQFKTAKQKETMSS